MTSTDTDSFSATSPITDGACAVCLGIHIVSVMIDGEVNIVAREKRTDADIEIYYTQARREPRRCRTSLIRHLYRLALSLT